MIHNPVEMSSEQQATEHLYMLGIAVERFCYVVEVAYADHNDPEEWKYHKAPYPPAVSECLGEIIQRSSLLEGILPGSDFIKAEAIVEAARGMRQRLHDVWMDHAHMGRLRHREQSLDAAETSETELNWEALFGSPFHVQGWATYKKTINTFESGLTPLFQVRFLLGRTQGGKQFPRPSSYDPLIGTLPGFDPAYVKGVLDTEILKLEKRERMLIEASLRESDSIGQPEADLESGAQSSNSQRGQAAGGSQPQSAIAAAINPDSSGELLANPKGRRSQAETDVLVSDYLRRHARNDPESITIDAILAAIGSSRGAIAKSTFWKTFHAARLSEKEPKKPRTIPLSSSMLATMPDRNAADPAKAELDLLMKEQKEEQDRDERRQRRRS